MYSNPLPTHIPPHFGNGFQPHSQPISNPCSFHPLIPPRVERPLGWGVPPSIALLSLVTVRQVAWKRSPYSTGTIRNFSGLNVDETAA